MTSRIIDDPSSAGWVETSPGFWEYTLAPLVEEAPVDSKQYARQDAAWSEVVIPEVPEVPDFVETDPTVPSHVKSITTTNISHWNTAWDEATEANGWGNHADAGYLTDADRLWDDIGSETGNNTIERFGDEVWVTQFKTDDIFIGTKIGNGVETTGDVTAGNATFSGKVLATNMGSESNSCGIRFAAAIEGGASTRVLPTDTSSIKDDAIDLGSASGRFKDAYFSRKVNAASGEFGGGSSKIRLEGAKIWRSDSSGSGLYFLGAGIRPIDSTGTESNGVLSLGTSAAKFKDGLFSGTVNANAFVGDGSGLTGLPASGISATDVTALYQNGSAKKVYTYGSGGRVTGNLLATADVFAYYSDERLKTKTGEIENALDKVDEIDCFYYTHNDIAKSLGYEGDDQQVGVSAQSVKAVMPECVGRAPIDDDGMGGSVSGEDYMTVKYERLVPLLLQSVKELTARVKELEGDR